MKAIRKDTIIAESDERQRYRDSIWTGDSVRLAQTIQPQTQALIK